MIGNRYIKLFYLILQRLGEGNWLVLWIAHCIYTWEVFGSVLLYNITILADSCEYGDEIDVARAELALRRALVRLDVAGNK